MVIVKDGFVYFSPQIMHMCISGFLRRAIMGVLSDRFMDSILSRQDQDGIPDLSSKIENRVGKVTREGFNLRYSIRLTRVPCGVA